MSRIFLEKLAVAQLVERYPVFQRTGIFTTLSPRPWQWSISLAKWIQFSHPTS